MVQTRVFGQFSGQKRAEGDTTKRSGDTKDRCTRTGSETEDERAADGREEANDDRGPIDRRERALRGYVNERIGWEKKTDPRGLRGSAGSRKVPDS